MPRVKNNKQIRKTREKAIVDLVNKYKPIAPAPSATTIRPVHLQQQNITTCGLNKYRAIAPAPDYSQPSCNQKHEIKTASFVETTPVMLTSNMGLINVAKENVNVAETSFLNVQNSQEIDLGTTSSSTEQPNCAYYLITPTNQLVTKAVLKVPNENTLYFLNSNPVNSTIMPYLTGNVPNAVQVTQSQRQTDGFYSHLNSQSNDTEAKSTAAPQLVKKEVSISSMINQYCSDDAKNNIGYLHLPPVNNEPTPQLRQLLNSDASETLNPNPVNNAVMSQFTSNVSNLTDTNLTQFQPQAGLKNENLDSNSELCRTAECTRSVASTSGRKPLKNKRNSNLRKLQKNELVSRINNEVAVFSTTKQLHLNMENDVTANSTNSNSVTATKEKERKQEITQERLDKVLQHVDSSLTLANGLKEMLLASAGDFLDEVIGGAAVFAKLREATTVEITDVNQYLVSSMCD